MPVSTEPSTTTSPAISIVTPCLNRKRFVRAAIESVLDQDGIEAEHIVVDGGSDDGTLDILAEYPHLRVTSEPDRGLYDAINKGIKRATGDIVGLLNTDDILMPGALRAVQHAARDHPEADAICGRMELYDPARSLRRPVGNQHMQALRLEDLISAQTLTNARFIARKAFERTGLFDIRYPACADRLFLAKFHFAGQRTVTIPQIIYRYTMHADSMTFVPNEVNPLLFEEMLRICDDALGSELGTEERRFFLRWAGWISGYLALNSVRSGTYSAAKDCIQRASAQDRIWLLRFFRHSLWHLSHRHEWR